MEIVKPANLPALRRFTVMFGKKGEFIMPGVIRHDAITLHDDVKEEDVEGFMQTELMPYFSQRYKGPTRTSVADLTHQSLLKDAESQGKYLWVTVWEVWDRSPESVRGASFEHTRMIRFEETDTLL